MHHFIIFFLRFLDTKTSIILLISVDHQNWQSRNLAYTGRLCCIRHIRPSRILPSGSGALALVLGRIYPIQSRHIPCIGHIRPPVGFQSHGTGSKSDISDPGWTYLMHQIYLTPCQVLEPWQLGLIRYILPLSDISD
jgi:hypothetical protein